MQIMTTRVDIAYPDTTQLSLWLRLGPCRVRLATTDDDVWVRGTYDDPTGMLPLEIRSEGGSALIAQRLDLGAGFGAVSAPVLDLAIGRGRPFALTMEVGAGDHALDLGGLPLTALTVKAGAGRYELDFSTPNTAAMSVLEIAAGAGAVGARHLANSNAAAIRVSGGVGRCVLDFGGELRRDMQARIDAGLAGIEVSVPATTPARITTKAVAAGTSVVGPLTRRGDGIYTAPGLEGRSPRLVADVTIAFGALDIRAT